MTTRHVLPFLAVCMAIAGSGIASAQETSFKDYMVKSGNDTWVREGFSVGPRALYFHSEDAAGERRDWYGGAQFRYHFIPHFAAELSADYRQERYNNPDTRTHVYPVQLSALLYLAPQWRLSPFVIGGLGWYMTRIDGPTGADTQNRFGPHIGAGLQYFFTDRWSLDSTWRYVFINDISTSKVSNAFQHSFNGNGWQATFGLNYHF